MVVQEYTTVLQIPKLADDRDWLVVYKYLLYIRLMCANMHLNIGVWHRWGVYVCVCLCAMFIAFSLM